MSSWKQKHINADIDAAEAKKRKLQQKFSCHVCGIAAKQFEPVYNDMGGFMFDQPSDLIQCTRCNKWTCDDCQYNKSCKLCLEGKGGLSYNAKANIIAWLIIFALIGACVLLNLK